MGVSSGADSIAALSLLSQCRSVIGYGLEVAHVHHGPTENSAQATFRDESKKFVENFCAQLGISFWTNKKIPNSPLKSEAELRDFRYGQLFQRLSELGENAWLVLGHHREDFLETVMINLVRGTGPQGLRSMKMMSEDNKFRPFLGESVEDLKSFLLSENIQWLEDPSNKSSDPLRNWMRNEWLQALEEKRPGSLKSLTRSMEIIGQQLGSGAQCYESFFEPNQDNIPREKFAYLTYDEKCGVLTTYFRRLGLKNFNKSHCDEVLKRLDTEQKSLDFSMLSCEWKVTRDCIKASRVCPL